jgi:glycosyltransferase involved in cell wall biosynthesis
MSRPTRVLELRSVWGTGGGPEKTILSGAERTDRSRFTVTVCYLRDLRDKDFTIDERAKAHGVDYIEILERHSFDPAIWTALKRIVDERQIDIVHAHEYKTNLLAWLIARRRKLIALSTVHGWFGRNAFRERIYYGVDKRVLARFPRVIAVSGALRDQLTAAGCSPGRVTVIPNGINHELFTRVPERRAAARQQLGLADTDIVIGAVGRLERQKRFDLLMEVLAALRATRPHLRLLIAGDGSLREELDAVHRRLNLGESCRLLGHTPDVIGLHHALDLFVQASDDEGSPNVVLEAMSLETPVVATNVGGTSDLIDDGVHGLLVPPGDQNALAGALARALDDWPATQERARAARRRVVDELSFERRMARVEAIYDDLMKKA